MTKRCCRKEWVVLGGTHDVGDWTTESSPQKLDRIFQGCCELMPSLQVCKTLIHSSANSSVSILAVSYPCSLKVKPCLCTPCSTQLCSYPDCLMPMQIKLKPLSLHTLWHQLPVPQIHYIQWGKSVMCK